MEFTNKARNESPTSFGSADMNSSSVAISPAGALAQALSDGALSRTSADDGAAANAATETEIEATAAASRREQRR